jgi:hypothetical protein
MDQKSSQLRQTEHQENLEIQHAAQNPGCEFASVDELLRFDAAQVEVPRAIANRLQESVQTEPKTKRRWWQLWGVRDSL